MGHAIGIYTGEMLGSGTPNNSGTMDDRGGTVDQLFKAVRVIKIAMNPCHRPGVRFFMDGFGTDQGLNPSAAGSQAIDDGAADKSCGTGYCYCISHCVFRFFRIRPSLGYLYRFSYNHFIPYLSQKPKSRRLFLVRLPIFENSHPVPVESRNLTGSSFIQWMAVGFGFRLDGSLAQRCGVRISFGRFPLLRVNPF
jgi:hypothetical protein